MTRLEKMLNNKRNGYKNFLCDQYEECIDCPFFSEGATEDCWECPLTNERAKAYLLKEV